MGDRGSKAGCHGGRWTRAGGGGCRLLVFLKYKSQKIQNITFSLPSTLNNSNSYARQFFHCHFTMQNIKCRPHPTTSVVIANTFPVANICLTVRTQQLSWLHPLATNQLLPYHTSNGGSNGKSRSRHHRPCNPDHGPRQ